MEIFKAQNSSFFKDFFKNNNMDIRLQNYKKLFIVTIIKITKM